MYEIIKRLLDKILIPCFYGTVTLTFRAGRLVSADVSQHLKPDDIK